MDEGHRMKTNGHLIHVQVKIYCAFTQSFPYFDKSSLKGGTWVDNRAGGQVQETGKIIKWS